MKNKFILSSIVFVLTLLATGTTAFAETMYVTSEIGLNIRRAPTTDSEKVGLLEYGDEVQVVRVIDVAGDDRDWAYIRVDRTVRAVCADFLSETEPEPLEQEEQTSSAYYGNCRITHYCHCAACCGRAGANCASGVQPTVGRTVANGSLPFGTRVLINGQEYVVEDRGVGAFEFDIFVASHDEAYARGLFYTDVYIIN